MNALAYDTTGCRRWNYFFVDQRPAFTLTYPAPGANESVSRILTGMTDAYITTRYDHCICNNDMLFSCGTKPAVQAGPAAVAEIHTAALL